MVKALEPIKLEPGDIMLLKQRKYPWYTWPIMTIVQIFKFFFLKLGLIEAVARFYHIEMAYGENLVFTEEPPKAHIAEINRKTKFRVFRMRSRPENFTDLFYAYCKEKMSIPFDYAKFWQLMLDAIFGTKHFTKGKLRPKEDVCAENVSRFYKEKMGQPCSVYEPESSIPADVNKYCMNHPELFEVVRDDEIK